MSRVRSWAPAILIPAVLAALAYGGWTWRVARTADAQARAASDAALSADAAIYLAFSRAVAAAEAARWSDARQVLAPLISDTESGRAARDLTLLATLLERSDATEPDRVIAIAHRLVAVADKRLRDAGVPDLARRTQVHWTREVRSRSRAAEMERERLAALSAALLEADTALGANAPERALKACARAAALAVPAELDRDVRPRRDRARVASADAQLIRRARLELEPSAPARALATLAHVSPAGAAEATARSLAARARDQIEQRRVSAVREEVLALYGRGDGRGALEKLRPERALSPLARRIADVLAQYDSGQAAARTGDRAALKRARAAVRSLDPDATTFYRRWAATLDEGAAELIGRARRELGDGRRAAAAALIGRAIRLAPKDPDAQALSRRVLRDLDLAFHVARQAWMDTGDDRVYAARLRGLLSEIESLDAEHRLRGLVRAAQGALGNR